MKQENETVSGAVAALDELDALALEAGPVEGEAQPIAEQQPPAPKEPPAREMLEPLFDAILDKYKIAPAKIEKLATVWGAVVDKWAPDGIVNKWGLELTAAFETWRILWPVIKAERAAMEAQAPEQKEAERAQEPGAPTYVAPTAYATTQPTAY